MRYHELRCPSCRSSSYLPIPDRRPPFVHCQRCNTFHSWLELDRLWSAVGGIAPVDDATQERLVDRAMIDGIRRSGAERTGGLLDRVEAAIWSIPPEVRDRFRIGVRLASTTADGGEDRYVLSLAFGDLAGAEVDAIAAALAAEGDNADATPGEG
jgi:hypothetical protein